MLDYYKAKLVIHSLVGLHLALMVAELADKF